MFESSVDHQHGRSAGGPAVRFENVRTARFGDRHLGRPPSWRVNPRGSGVAWKANGAARHGIRVLSSPPLYGALTGQEIGTRSKRAGSESCGDQDLNAPPFLCSPEVRRARERVQASQQLCRDKHRALVRLIT